MVEYSLPVVYTVGHSTRSFEELVAHALILRGHEARGIMQNRIRRAGRRKVEGKEIFYPPPQARESDNSSTRGHRVAAQLQTSSISAFRSDAIV